MGEGIVWEPLGGHGGDRRPFGGLEVVPAALNDIAMTSEGGFGAKILQRFNTRVHVAGA
ncbi:hypothetical protein TWF696_004842 [Orbilia brochopaga]|uniref:Uncharacterized protein n=1 Tax=Orbilia brochopaga TaxID=3140254 RepID=A0AAV9UYY0_9PEZI